MSRNIVHLVGSDGAGKSTILKSLQDNYPATYIHEPYHPEIIQKIHESTSIFEKIDLFAQDRHMLYKSLKYDSTIISDRSFICSMVYQSLELESQHWPPFMAIKHIYQAQYDLIPPTLVIYIHANPITIYHRLQSRERTHHLTIEQIVHIQARYNYIFDMFHIKVLPIDTSHTSLDNNVSKIISHLQ